MLNVTTLPCTTDWLIICVTLSPPAASRRRRSVGSAATNGTTSANETTVGDLISLKVATVLCRAWHSVDNEWLKDACYVSH